MIKPNLSIVLTFLLLAPSVSFASTKYITLKDGSVIKGELVSFDNGTYTVQTDNLGQLQLPEANVVSIANQALPVANPSQVGQPNFSNRVSDMQNQIVADPQAMEAVKAMAEDPQIASLVSDPNFVQKLSSAISSGNVDSVADDPRIQELMNNPKMQALIQQLQENDPQQ